ncbi:MAG: flippase, partial [Candidatus Magnetoovum sp. WYHC-5]|nr:flippase [Candidatus Magnetoovum sp. WYHC-5]
MGIYTLSLTALNLISVIGNLGFDTTAVRLVSEYSSKTDSTAAIRNVYLKSLIVVVPFCIALSVLFFSISSYIAETVFHKGGFAPYLKLIALCILPFTLIAIHAEGLRGLKKIFHYSLLHDTLLPFVCLIVISIGGIFFKKSDFIPVIAYVVSIFAVSIYGLILWFKYVKIRGTSKRYKGITWRELFSMSIPMFFTSFFILTLNWVDKLILGIYVSESEVGIYNVAFKLSAVTSLFLLSINSISAPKFAQYYANGDMKRLELTAKQAVKLLFISSTPILAILFIFSDPILGIFGTPFKDGHYALLMLTFGQFVNSICGSVGLILLMTGKEKTLRNILFFCVIVSILLHVVLIPHFGINGAAFSTAVGFILANLLAVFYIKQHYGFYTFAFLKRST